MRGRKRRGSKEREREREREKSAEGTGIRYSIAIEISHHYEAYEAPSHHTLVLVLKTSQAGEPAGEPAAAASIPTPIDPISNRLFGKNSE